MAFKMKGSPHKMGSVQGTSSAMKMVSPIKQGSDFEKMYKLEDQVFILREKLDEAQTDEQKVSIQAEITRLNKEIDAIHVTLKGGNIKPGYTGGERDKSKDETYPQ